MDFRLRYGESCPVSVSDAETEAVKIAVQNLKTDLQRTMGAAQSAEDRAARIVIGTVGISKEVEKLADIRALQDENGRLRREAYLCCVSAGRLVIAGTDRRGTIYGIYDLCERLGVSPFYFWADVPVKRREELFFPEGYKKIDYPSVEYRGIFINDEEELEAWVKNRMGEATIGVRTYEKIFELLLRLKGNYIWPAMHVNSFNMVKENGALAERMGIVVGTSHCDMLMRSNNREWKPWLEKKGYQGAKYDYSIPGKNREILREYWRESVEQNRDFEVCYTLGMRGIHDSGFETEALENGTEEERRKAKTELLSAVISDQKKILQETLGHDTMMTFIPYKEVLAYYDGGLKVPEDLTLVWANDNYGYIRRYPSGAEKKRKGGNGIYYHNSYWAPPSMSYVFLCSIPLAHTGNELRKAYREGIQKLWVMNVGALKPLEQETAYFLRLAWEIGKPGSITEDVDAYAADWIDRTFSGGIGKRTAELLNDFSQLTNVRKLENMGYGAFSQTAYGDEAAVRLHEYERLFDQGNAIYEGLAECEKDAFFQLVLFRIHAAYFTNLQFYYGDRSTLMYDRGWMQAAALYTKKAREFDDARRKLIVYYNRVLADGKWEGIINPEGFPPPRAAMMAICTPPLFIGERKMLVHIWNGQDRLTFTKPGVKWIEIGNGGRGEFCFQIEAPAWLKLSAESGVVRTEERILAYVADVSENREGMLKIRNLTDDTVAEVFVEILSAGCGHINVETDGIIAVEAALAPLERSGFCRIKRLGRGTGDLVEACGTDGDAQTGEFSGLSYSFFLLKQRDCLLEIHRFPSLDSVGRIRIGVSVDGKAVQVVESLSTDEWRGNWKRNVLDNVDRLYLKLPRLQAGPHKISFHAIDKYFAFSRFIIYTEERRANNYAGIAGGQSLPECRDAESLSKRYYGEIALAPRTVAYACPEKEADGLALNDIVKSEKTYGKETDPMAYIEQGSLPQRERGGAICIDAACVLAQSRYAYTTGGGWRHCGSESYGRSGLAMYVREHGPIRCQEEAPALHYRVKCLGGAYTLWVYAKFGVREEAEYAVAYNGVFRDREKLYGGGNLWRYEAEQIWRWVPVDRIEAEAGEYELQLCSLAPGLLFDRICLIRGKELPPPETEWRRKNG